MLKWVSNTFDPKLSYARIMVIPIAGESPDQAWEHKLRWLEGKIIGLPQKTEKYSCAELTEMGMVGVYVEEN